MNWRLLLIILACVFAVSGVTQASPISSPMPSAPHVVSTSPGNGRTDIPIDARISITFDMPMHEQSTSEAVAENPHIDWTCMWDSPMTMTFDPVTLDYDTVYTITVMNSAMNLDGINLAKEYKFQFKTVSGSGSSINIMKILSSTVFQSILLGIAFIVGLVILISFKQRTWRCPQCKKRFWQKYGLCPNCGYDIHIKSNITLSFKKRG
jgi:hypothetical protein